MGSDREHAPLNLKEWAIKRMEYVPRVSNKENNKSQNNFQGSLFSGRLSTFWQHLILHARSRSQVQHIRDNLRLVEFQNDKNKKSSRYQSTNLSAYGDLEETVRSNKSIYTNRNINAYVPELDSSAPSERSYLLKEYDETKYLLRKSAGHIKKAKMDAECQMEECNELKNRLNANQNQVSQNYEKLKFISLLIQNTKTSIKIMKSDSLTLSSVLQTRFEYSKNKVHNEPKQEYVYEVKNMLSEILQVSKNVIDQATRITASQKTILFNAEATKKIKQLIGAVLLPKCTSDTIDANYKAAAMLHETTLAHIRSIIMDMNKMLKPDSTKTHQAGRSPLETIFDEWREDHVTLAAQSKTLVKEIVSVESEVQRQCKKSKEVISDVVDSTITLNSDHRDEINSFLSRYFLLCEKQARLKALFDEIHEKICKKKEENSLSTNLKVLVAAKLQYHEEINNKKEQINRLLYRNGNINKKIDFLQKRMHLLLNTDILSSIQQILSLIDWNETANTNPSVPKDRIRWHLKNFVIQPVYLGTTLNVHSHILGRDVTWLLKNVHHLLNSEKCPTNVSLLIAYFAQVKLQMKQTGDYIEKVTIFNEKNALFQNSCMISDMEQKVKKSKDKSELVHKLEDVIAQITLAQKRSSNKVLT